MYKCYNLKIDNMNYFDAYKSDNRSYITKIGNAVKAVLDNFINDRGILDGKKLCSDWFPAMKSHVFISHAHKDHELAVGFSGWLKREFELDSFIDSCVWGHTDDLIEIIDDKYSKNYNNELDYDKVKMTTAHVHMMLSTALTKMIDSCECIVFLNTPSSISASESVDKGKTGSAWLYSEILITSLIRENIPKRKVRTAGLESFGKRRNEGLQIDYDLDLGHMMRINDRELKQWKDNCSGKKGSDALDMLYSMGR